LCYYSNKQTDKQRQDITAIDLWRMLVGSIGCEINVPFQHKNRLHRGQGLE